MGMGDIKMLKKEGRGGKERRGQRRLVVSHAETAGDWRPRGVKGKARGRKTPWEKESSSSSELEQQKAS